MRQTSGMDREHALATARTLVAERFPDAAAAWVAGSVVAGEATRTSDLDITVLLDDLDAPYRESTEYDGWPVELFVHTRASIDHFVAKDLDRRRPTMARLVSSGLLLVDRDGAGAATTEACAAVVAAGPAPLGGDERDRMRYALTDLLDDLADAADPQQRVAVAVTTWQLAAELLLAASGHWWGTGKWLVRELRRYDEAHGTSYTLRLHAGLTAAVDGDPVLLTVVVEEILDASGGRLWTGYRATAADWRSRPT